MVRRRDLQRQPLADREPVAFDSDELPRVVAQQAHRSYANLAQDLYTNSVIALIGLESQALVGFDRVEPLVLQLVRPDFVGQTDAAAFLIQVQQHAPALARDSAKRRVELRATIAPCRVEDGAGQARRVNADEDVAAVADVAADEG